MAGQHAKLSPSAAHRWMNCPGSIALSAKAPKQKTSVHAAEGTVAHSIVEQYVSGQATLPQLIDKIGEEVECDGHTITVDEAMIEAAEEYFELGNQLKSELDRPAPVEDHVEKRVHVKVGEGEPNDLWGTADRLIYQKGHRLFVVDFKYGKGKTVEVYKNEQMLVYAAAAMDSIAGRAFDTVSLIIHQPRAFHPDGPVRRWDIKPEDVDAFRDELLEGVEATRQPDAPLCVGDWCRWCPAATICTATHSKAQEIAKVDFADAVPPTTEEAALRLPSVETLSVQQMADALKWEDPIVSMFRAMRERMKQMLLDGEDVPGFKLVEGRSRRKIEDEESVVQALSLMHPEDELYERKLKGITKLQALVGKKKVTELEAKGWIVKPPGALTLVPTTDKREDASPRLSAQEEFQEVNGNGGGGSSLFEGIGTPKSTVWPQD